MARTLAIGPRALRRMPYACFTTASNRLRAASSLFRSPRKVAAYGSRKWKLFTACRHFHPWVDSSFDFYNGLGVVSNQMCNSEPQPRLQAIRFNTPHMNARAYTKLASQPWKAVVLRVALQECKSSARAEARARTNVAQSVRPQPIRSRKAVAAREASVALPLGLRLESGMQSSVSSTATPNPSYVRTESQSSSLKALRKKSSRSLSALQRSEPTSALEEAQTREP